MKSMFVVFFLVALGVLALANEEEPPENYVNKIVRSAQDSAPKEAGNGIGSKVSKVAKTVGNGLKSGATKVVKVAKTVGNGLKSGAQSFWSWGKNLLYKGASLLAKIPKFFGRKK